MDPLLARRASLARPASVRGVSLHGGRAAVATLRPAPEGQGCRFIRADLPGEPWAPLRIEAVTAGALATHLRWGRAEVRTVEHLAAALLVAGIDDLDVVLDGDELPLLDGASVVWSALIRSAGRVPSSAPRRWLRLRGSLRVEAGDAWIQLLPGGGLRFDVSVDFGPTMGGLQRLLTRPLDGDFASALAWAPTFGRLEDHAALLAAGAARGAHLDAVLVYGPTGPLQGPPLADRLCARHKSLDLLGDLALLGAPLLAHVRAHKHGHALVHTALRRALSEGLLEWEDGEPERPRPQ